MKVTAKQVQHVGTLARLKIFDNEVDAYKEHLQKILDYAGELDKVNTDSVEPMFSPVYENIDIYTKSDTYLREDEVKESLSNHEILKNAPAKKNGQFELNAVIEEE
jgi:aspartyl-tRNA(Asn)/glutamyl-tRNA(Gln) amidotransferase subunit C